MRLDIGHLIDETKTVFSEKKNGLFSKSLNSRNIFLSSLEIVRENRVLKNRTLKLVEKNTKEPLYVLQADRRKDIGVYRKMEMKKGEFFYFPESGARNVIFTACSDPYEVQFHIASELIYFDEFRNVYFRTNSFDCILKVTNRRNSFLPVNVSFKLEIYRHGDFNHVFYSVESYNVAGKMTPTVLKIGRSGENPLEMDDIEFMFIEEELRLGGGRR